MQTKKLKVLITASGTGGHLFPAQQLAQNLEYKNAEVFFAAKDLSIKTTFNKKKYKYKDIDSYPISKNIFLFLYKVLKGFIQSIVLILRFKPDVVVGFGSYHTFPVMLAAYFLRKKIVLFDSNSSLGLVNKIFAKVSKKVAVQFPVLEKKYGNIAYVKRLPWVEDKKVSYISFFKENLFTILIFGGSQGAKVINDHFLKSIERLENVSFQVIHLIGRDQNINFFKKFYKEKNIAAYVSFFEKDMHQLYMNADLVISRAGACSIAEMIHFEVPSIVIPFEQAKNDHQLKNAVFMKETVKGSYVLEENELKTGGLFQVLDKVLKNKNQMIQLKSNIQKFKSLEKNQNKKELCDLVLEVGNQYE